MSFDESKFELQKEIKTCDECGSKFYASASKMQSLCPECASILYGYENCNHVFENGRCVKCFWDGSRSEYVREMAHETDKSAEPRQLNAQEWTEIIHDVLDVRMAEDFGLMPIKERCWANSYDDNERRRVISLFMLNDMSATIKWGWNFAYIPRISGNKCVWARTDKSIYAHTFRLSEEFINGGATPGKRKSVFGRDGLNNSEGLGRIIEEIETAYKFVNDDIKTYFDKTGTDAGMLAELENICEQRYYRFIHPENRLIKICLENRMGQSEKAIDEFEKVAFESEKLKADYGKRIGL